MTKIIITQKSAQDVTVAIFLIESIGLLMSKALLNKN